MESSRTARWRRKVKRSRPVTPFLESEISQLNFLYGKLADLEINSYNLERLNDETYTFTAGEMGSFDSEPNVRLRRSRNDIHSSMDEIRREINAIFICRKSLLLTEMANLRRKHNLIKLSKVKQKSIIRGRLNSLHEIRRTMRGFEKLKKKREETYKLDVKDRKKRIRLEDQEARIRREHQRKRDNVHNFTNFNIDMDLITFLDRGGGYVPFCSKTFTSQRTLLDFKRQAEEVLLTFSKKVTGQSSRAQRCHQSGKRLRKISKRTVRSQIRLNLNHPNMTRANRDFIYNSLRLIDRYRATSFKKLRLEMPFCKVRRGDSRQLDYLKNILKKGGCSLRESDKKLGWSLNSVDWYEREYRRQLLTDFYSWACGKDKEDQLKNAVGRT